MGGPKIRIRFASNGMFEAKIDSGPLTMGASQVRRSGGFRFMVALARLSQLGAAEAAKCF